MLPFPLPLACNVLPFGIVVERSMKKLLYILLILSRKTPIEYLFYIRLQIKQQGTQLSIV